MRQIPKNLLALCLGISFLLLIEAGCALLGVVPLSREDPFVGFEGSLPLFLRGSDERGTYFHLNPAKERYFDRQRFRMPKPKKVFRTVAFGGSTTYGRPYLNDTSFPSWMNRLLQRYSPDRTYEVINAGGISYASYRVRRLVEELAAFSPDLYIIYSGHNEFLESRTFEKIIGENPGLRRVRAILHRSHLYSGVYRLLNSLTTNDKYTNKTVLGDQLNVKLEEVGGPELYRRDDRFREGVIAQYRHNIETIVRYCKDRGIPLVLCTLTSNLSGVSPFKSEHAPDLSHDERRSWWRVFTAAQEVFRSGRYGEALRLLREAEGTDSHYALLHFGIGETLRNLGSFDEAFIAFVRAKEEDIIPLRALEVFNEILREVARREGVPLADIERGFREASPEGITGPGLFLDHVHPTLEGQQLMARIVLEKAAEAGLVPVTANVFERNREDARDFLAGEVAKVSPRYLAMGIWGVGRLFHWAGMYSEAYDALLQAWETVRDVEEIPRLLGAIELWRGQPAAARDFFRESLKIEAGNPKALLGLARAYVDLGDGRSALKTMGDLSDSSKEGAEYHGTRGEALMVTGALDASVSELEAAARLAPQVRGYTHSLARAYLLSGKEEEGRRSFERFLELSGEEWSDGAYREFRKNLPSPSIAPPGVP